MEQEKKTINQRFYKNLLVNLILCLLLALGAAAVVQSQTSAFTYQRRWTDNAAANGSYQMQFKIYTAETGGTQQGITVTETVLVINGVFTVKIDPTIAPFIAGENGYLEIAVRLSGSGNPYTILTPRQQITSAPFAVQSGGAFSITQSVVASGGRNSSGGAFALDGTIGQSLAGQTASNAPFTLNAGLWNPANLAPTAGGVTLGGWITTASGIGIRNVNVTLRDINSETRMVRSGAGGFYSFSDVGAGEIFIVSVSAKRYRFAPSSQIHSAIEDNMNINFTAENNGIVPLLPILTDSKN